MYLKKISKTLFKAKFDKNQDINYYAESFYCYQISKLHYQQAGIVTSCKVLTANYVQGEDPLLLSVDGLGGVLCDFFVNII